MLCFVYLLCTTFSKLVPLFEFVFCSFSQFCYGLFSITLATPVALCLWACKLQIVLIALPSGLPRALVLYRQISFCFEQVMHVYTGVVCQCWEQLLRLSPSSGYKLWPDFEDVCLARVFFANVSFVLFCVFFSVPVLLHHSLLLALSLVFKKHLKL